MSIAAVEYVFQHSKMDGTALVLMLAIAHHTNHESRDAFPSRPTLAQCIKRSPKRVTELISECEAAGELYVIYRHGRANHYVIAGFADKPTDARAPKQRVARDMPDGAVHARRNGQLDTPDVTSEVVTSGVTTRLGTPDVTRHMMSVTSELGTPDVTRLGTPDVTLTYINQESRSTNDDSTKRVYTEYAHLIGTEPDAVAKRRLDDLCALYTPLWVVDALELSRGKRDPVRYATRICENAKAENRTSPSGRPLSIPKPPRVNESLRLALAADLSDHAINRGKTIPGKAD